MGVILLIFLQRKPKYNKGYCNCVKKIFLKPLQHYLFPKTYKTHATKIVVKSLSEENDPQKIDFITFLSIEVCALRSQTLCQGQYFTLDVSMLYAVHVTASIQIKSLSPHHI